MTSRLVPKLDVTDLTENGRRGLDLASIDRETRSATLSTNLGEG
jgi:hypothetical protein